MTHNAFLQSLAVFALIAFIGGVGLFGIDHFWGNALISDRLVPDTLFGALGPPLMILLFYELLSLAQSFSHSLIECVRRQFEVLSLILLRDVFKDIDLLVSGSQYSVRLLTDIAIIAFGSVGLYFVIELLERLQKRYDKMTAHVISAGYTRAKNALSALAVITITVIASVFVLRWLLVPNSTGLDAQYFAVSLSCIALFSALLLFISIIYVKGYESLFENSALVLASLVSILSLNFDPSVRVLALILSAVFVVTTLLLHGFARGKTSIANIVK